MGWFIVFGILGVTLLVLIVHRVMRVVRMWALKRIIYDFLGWR